jgi:hypothetical protein
MLWTFSRSIVEWDAGDKISIKKFWRQFNIKITIILRLSRNEILI